jgi:two pore calcium channel protein 3
MTDWFKVSGEAYFPTFLESYWDLYVLATTANSPDIMMPAYEENPWYVHRYRPG